MKIAVMIMAGDKEPSLRNVETLKDTMVKNSTKWNLKNSYDFFTYSYKSGSDPDDTVLDCTRDKRYPNCYDMHICGTESVYYTYEKTYTAYEYLLNNEDAYGEYDWFVRINISCYVNLKLLDAVVEKLKKDTIYANALNTYIDYNFKYCNCFYPRGDFYMVSHETLKEIMPYGSVLMYCDGDLFNHRPEVPHVDDTLFGYAFLLANKGDTFDRLQMIYYNFMPMTSDNKEELRNMVQGNFNKNAIATRVKSTPNGLPSGYSWDDNVFRLCDPEKIRIADEIVSETEYENVSLEDITVPPLQERPTIYVAAQNLTPSMIMAIKGR